MAVATTEVSGQRLRRSASRVVWSLVAVVPAVIVLWPVAMLVGGILRPNVDMWAHQWDTRLPGEIRSTLVLLVGVVITSLVLGVSLAWVVGTYRFPGRRVLSWALVLPLAIPAYILGFITTAVFGIAGPVQTWWRDTFGQDAWFPEVRSMPFAILTMSLSLYPYVYLLARAALRDQATEEAAVARTLGAGPAETFRRVVLPTLRPAIAAGGAIVAMETLTDFGTAQYFGIDTVTVGVFRIWRGTYDRDAASEIATLVLGFAVLLIAIERIQRGRARFGRAGGQAAGTTLRTMRGWHAWAATAGTTVVLLAAFLAPLARLIAWTVAEQRSPRGTPQLDRFPAYLRDSLSLTLITVGICTVVGVAVANAETFARGRVVRAAARGATVGYAVPGPVVAMGVVLAAVAADRALGAVGGGLPGTIATGSFFTLVFAYSVRFLAPALTSVQSGVGHIPSDVTASARTLGARPLRVLGRIHVPLSWTSILTAALLVAVDALKELPIALLLRPIGFETLSVWTYGLASESRFQQAALPALSIVLVATLPVVLLTRRLDRA